MPLIVRKKARRLYTNLGISHARTKVHCNKSASIKSALPLALFGLTGREVSLHWWQTWGLMFALSVQGVPREICCKTSLLACCLCLLCLASTAHACSEGTVSSRAPQRSVCQNWQSLRAGSRSKQSSLSVNCGEFSYGHNHNTCKKKIPSHVLY